MSIRRSLSGRCRPWLSLTFSWAETVALVDFAAETPHARHGLADVAALTRLLGDIASSPQLRRSPPEDHLMGDKLDVDLAIKRVFKSVGVRRFGGRPVRSEPLPPPRELVEQVRGELPAWVRARVSDGQLLRQVGRFLDVRPWPFDGLVSAPPDNGGSESSCGPMSGS